MSVPLRANKVQKYTTSKMERLEARVSSTQKNLFQHAADLLGRTLTDFIISGLQEIATRVIRESELMQLSLPDRKAFVQALLNPPKPNNQLLKAAKRYQKEVKS